ncbi:DUF3667 domain-containing protein [Parasphingorhabdus halotolerans]|uniref:DUF3667 domain-containing protein n=1 Tax=Parasphingorhabdus halotolerans TaxID=2725558 RepID=A0A6H2DMV2_9SPHN|nr:DUF3667 domain-containing protein [Parasphingorhabdus halotolerans]QJB69285.1 DUF3667 domain-containing protein [Parasphingorhabdus halotolerans]
MSDDFEAIGTAIEGGLVAKAVDDEGNAIRAEGDVAGNCLNCETPVLGKYCSNCGQPLHVHRSIGALWHDILHGVLHFEGKFWRTLPLLAWKPGDLTRRYIHGERARFISPMALFLFSVFMMFAVFSFVGDPFSSGGDEIIDKGIDSGIVAQAEEIDGKIKAKTAQLPQATGDNRVKLENDILDLKKGRNILATLTGEDAPFPEISLSDGDTQIGNYSDEELEQIQAGMKDIQDGNVLTDTSRISTGSPEADKWLRDAVKNVTSNPDLLLYKLKANGYKFAWLLIPISVPFVWLTMIGRRGFHFYDHSVFATYSIAFMSLLFIFCAILAAVGVTEGLWASLLVFYPPIHMYRQLRHAYQLSRPEAIIRVIFLFVFTIISIIIFFLILLALGVLG